MSATGEAERLLGVGDEDLFVGEGDVDRVVRWGLRLCWASDLPRICETHSTYLDTH